MKINFTKSEYQILLDVIYMADWILHAHDTEDRSNTKEYSDLFQKLMSYAKDMGCEDLVDFDKQQKISPNHSNSKRNLLRWDILKNLKTIRFGAS